MFWRKSKSAWQAPTAYLTDVQEWLEGSGVKTSLAGSTLTCQCDDTDVHVSLVRPEKRDSPAGPISAVMQVTSMLPRELASFMRKRAGLAGTMNRFAMLGGVYDPGAGKLRVGSRLTLHEADASAWAAVHLPLVTLAVTQSHRALIDGAAAQLSDDQVNPRKAAESLMGGWGRPKRNRVSAWTRQDMVSVQRRLAQFFVCTAGPSGLTAEFGLEPGQTSAALGPEHANTALLQLFTDQPHPALGAGLFGLLQMPHQAGDARRAAARCMRLNRWEMATDDLPPHFGAWCPGGLGSNSAYVFFLPNVAHRIEGVALNFAMWCASRAREAARMLETMEPK